MGSNNQIEGIKPIIFFDGVCNLCNASVNFIIDRDPREYFLFASLQSEIAIKKLAPFSKQIENTDSVMLFWNDRLYIKSAAALEIAGMLSGGWRWLKILKILPVGFRDWFYDLIAKNRYRWFGKRDHCRVPTPELKQRFLDSYQVS